MGAFRLPPKALLHLLLHSHCLESKYQQYQERNFPFLHLQVLVVGHWHQEYWPLYSPKFKLMPPRQKIRINIESCYWMLKVV